MTLEDKCYENKKKRARQRNGKYKEEVRRLEKVVCSIKWSGQGGLVEKAKLMQRVEAREAAKCFLAEG